MASRSFWKFFKQTPVMVPLTYAALASLWIFFSDRVVAVLADDAETLTQLQTYKGWFFVATTTVLLAVLIYWRQRALHALNASLEGRVRKRTRALESANQELSTALEHLRRTQDDLVQSEKLAALGAMVAGVAHELNTPIGNSLIVASTFAENTTALERELAAGGIRKSSFESYLREANNAASLIVRNLGKASELVTSFKQVAVDRTSSKRREFPLNEVVTEILTMLRPGFRRLPITVESTVPEAILLDSYPGPLGQVLTNLIENAIVHGLDGGREGGRIEITGRKTDADRVELRVCDNGKGVEPDHLSHIFEPFFTTRFGQGGSGLGLHIVHHLVTNVLGGRVSVRTGGETAFGCGCEFVLDLPCHAATELAAQ